MSNRISYSSIYKIKETFKRTGTNTGSDFNKYDTLAQKYFKIIFYFYNGADGITLDKTSNGGTGLLHPTWNCAERDTNNLYKNNTAYSYLAINGELERAKYLKEFISLLSNISSESPWYFSEITGLDAALERNIKDMKFEEERKKISIKCLPDSFDDRIGTMMDLYRAVVWSWQTKREMVPSNLRKFDMGIYIFNDAVEPFHKFGNKYTDNLPEWLSPDEYAVMGSDSSGYRTSYKYIEFHNCEFDYNSGKTPYGTLTNKEGLQPEYTIDIHFDDCYETRYNEFMMKEFGDMIMWDVNFNANRSSFDKSSDQASDLSKRINYYNGGMLSNAGDQLLTAATDWVSSKAKGLLLGNLYSLSLTRVGDQISTLMNGGVMETANAIARNVKNNNYKKVGNNSIGSNLFEDTMNKELSNTQPDLGTISDNSNLQSTDNRSDLGNIGGGKFDQHNKGEVAMEDGNKYFNDSLDGNIFDDSVSVRHAKGDVRKEDLFEEPPTPYVNTHLGNIFSAQTLVNNL